MDGADKRDANLEQAIDEALAPYRDLLPAEALESFREIMRDELSRHPVSATLLKQLAPPPMVQQSDDLVRGDGAAEAPGESAAKASANKASNARDGRGGGGKR